MIKTMRTKLVFTFLFLNFVTLTMMGSIALGAGTLKVTAPNGDEEWVTGTKYTVKWEKGDAGTKVKIELLKARKVYKTVKKRTKNDGRYRWKVPSSVKTGDKYKIRITSITDSDISDSSDNKFTITKSESDSGGLRVTSPNGGEAWKPGSTYTIEWNKGAGAASDADYVGIKLYEGSGGGGTLVETIEEDPGEEERTPIKANDGSYSWTIPEDLASGTKYEIRIKAKNAEGVVEEDASDTAFTISTGGNLSLKSAAFRDGKEIPKKYTCEGSDTKLTFTISGMPGGAKSLVLFLDDLDGTPTATNTSSDWNHWVLYIPRDIKRIRASSLPAGSTEGRNDAGDASFDPICPPGDKNNKTKHTYRFSLFALNKKINVETNSTRSEVVTAMKGYLLEKVSLSGYYGVD